VRIEFADGWLDVDAFDDPPFVTFGDVSDAVVLGRSKWGRPARRRRPRSWGPAHQSARPRAASEQKGSTMKREPQPFVTERTGQITLRRETTSDLVVHEDYDGSPLCNLPIRPWHGKPAGFTPQGAGVVTCRLCQRTHA
jgi:hypothetical protein